MLINVLVAQSVVQPGVWRHARRSSLAQGIVRVVRSSLARRLAGTVFNRAAGMGHTELCRLLRTLVEPLQPTGYYQLIVGI